MRKKVQIITENKFLDNEQDEQFSENARNAEKLMDMKAEDFFKKKKALTKKIDKASDISSFIGGNKGRLRKGYKYSGKKLKNGKSQIVKVQVGGPSSAKKT